MDEHEEALRLWEELARQFGVLIEISRYPRGRLFWPATPKAETDDPPID